MACQPRKWFYGVLPLAALWLGVNWVETERIEKDISGRATAALRRVDRASGAPRVEGRDIILKGEIADAGARGAALSGVAALAGVRRVVDAQSVAPASPAPVPGWSAAFDKGVLTLTGAVASPDARVEILALARKKFPDAKIVDDMTYAQGAPADVAAKAAMALGALALSSGAVVMAEHKASANQSSSPAADTQEAVAPPSTEKPAEAKPLASVPAASSAAPNASASKPAVEAAACQARLSGLLTEHPILFVSGSARLRRESVGVLDALAAAANKCPQVAFEIAGHTDDVGAVGENLELSRRRAESVLVYLVSAGVAPERLTGAGYGEGRPLAPNDSDENRAKNRRIEFNLK